MYTAIREPDGSLTFHLHLAPERLTAREARAALAALDGILGDLRRRAGSRPPPEIPAPLRPRPARLRSGRAAEQRAPAEM